LSKEGNYPIFTHRGGATRHEKSLSLENPLPRRGGAQRRGGYRSLNHKIHYPMLSRKSRSRLPPRILRIASSEERFQTKPRVRFSILAVDSRPAGKVRLCCPVFLLKLSV